MNIKNFINRYDKARQVFEKWRNIHEECYDLAIPNRNKFENNGVSMEGEHKNTHLYDNTAVDSVAIFASRLLQMVAPVDKKFFRLEYNELVKYDLKEVYKLSEEEIKKEQEKLDKITDIFFHFWQNSNASQQLHESFFDLAVGTSAILTNEMEEKEEPFMLNCVNIFDLAIEEGYLSSVDTVFRKHNINLKSIKQLWPMGQLPMHLEDQINFDPTEKHEVIEGVVYNQKTKKYDYKVVLKEDEFLVYSEVYNTNPWAVTRYKKVSNETYGRGLLMDLLPDIKVVNKASEFLMRAAEKSSSELFIVNEDGIINSDIMQSLMPDSIIPTTDIDAFRRLPFQGRPDLTQLYLQEKQFNIKKKLLADSIDRPKALSPEEIQALNNEKLFDTGATFKRLTKELLEPIILRIFDILERKNIIDFKFDKNKHVIKYTNPLARAQDLQDNNNIINTLMQAYNTFGVEQTNLIIDKEKMVKDFFINADFAEKYLKTEKEIKKQKEAIQQAQKEAQLQQMQQENNRGKQ